MLLEEFDFVLFDFDGLLVDTERLHFAAYKQAFADYNEPFPYDFVQYCQATHQCEVGIVKGVENWEAIKEKKQNYYVDLIETSNVDLMPGVEEVLKDLKERLIGSCVVTNSQRRSINAIRSKIATLDLIPNWITREDYTHPKPSPDGYQTAIKLFAPAGAKVIGFEDTPKGIKALVDAGVTAVLIGPDNYFGLKDAISMGAVHRSSFFSMLMPGVS